jgi:hypothetical protein
MTEVKEQKSDDLSERSDYFSDEWNRKCCFTVCHLTSVICHLDSDT